MCTIKLYVLLLLFFVGFNLFSTAPYDLNITDVTKKIRFDSWALQQSVLQFPNLSLEENLIVPLVFSAAAWCQPPIAWLSCLLSSWLNTDHHWTMHSREQCPCVLESETVLDQHEHPTAVNIKQAGCEFQPLQ